MGDDIYGDIRCPMKLFVKERTIGTWKNVPRFIASSEPEMQVRCDKDKSNYGYSRLRENAKVLHSKFPSSTYGDQCLFRTVKFYVKSKQYL